MHRTGSTLTRRHAGWGRPAGFLLGLAALAQVPMLIGIPDWAARIPLEPLALGLALLAVPPGRLSWLRWPAAALFTTAWVVLTMERLAFAVLGRPLKLWLDLQLVGPGLELISGAMSLSVAVLVAVGLVAVPLAVFAVAVRLSGGLLQARAPRLAVTGAAVALAGMAAAPTAPVVTGHFLTDAVRTQVERSLRLAEERQVFAGELERDPWAAGSPPLDGLGGADVVVLFVESYGAAALEDPRYAPRIRRTLADLEARLSARDLAQASGWLASPTIGGQSWLAHASLASGLWVDSQDRWDMLVASDRRLLTHAFVAAGYETALVMPAIVKAWPEAAFFGFDRTYFHRDLGYAGPPYAWVTMPDQFTLAQLDRKVLAGARRAPAFAQVALISSHAPWTPIPPVIGDWARIGDGAIFAEWAEPPIPPRELWLDSDAVRAAYVEALDYVLQAIGAWLERPWERPRLVLIVGDHEAGAVISGPGADSVVPVHAVSDRPDLALRLAQAGLAPGLVPPERPDDRMPPAMSDFRRLFLDAFAAPPSTPVSARPGGGPT